MMNFEKALINYVKPYMEAQGYHYNIGLREKDILYGFSKELDESIRTIVQFQRKQEDERASGLGFTVNLIRQKEDQYGDKVPYDGYLWARLGEVLWFVYNQSIYPSYNQWWISESIDDIEDMFFDVVKRLEQYGIPWLEDPNSKQIGDISAYNKEQFQQVIISVVSPPLEKLGYRRIIRQDRSSYYVKELPFGMYTFIEFSQNTHIDRPGLGFDVILQRKSIDNPDNFSQGQDLYGTLSLIMNVALKIDRFPFPNFTWEYKDRKDLVKKVKEVLNDLHLHAIPWLENPDSQNIT
jgi:hypothetical protein